MPVDSFYLQEFIIESDIAVNRIVTLDDPSNIIVLESLFKDIG